jgi:hypothetical protein
MPVIHRTTKLRIPMPERRSQSQDHDLLVALHEQVKQVRVDIKELKDGTATRLSDLENNHVTRDEYKDHETRLRFVEKYVWGAIAIISLINLVGFAYIVSILN